MLLKDIFQKKLVLEMKKNKLMKTVSNKEVQVKELAKIEQGLKALDDKKAEEDYKDAIVFKR